MWLSAYQSETSKLNELAGWLAGCVAVAVADTAQSFTKDEIEDRWNPQAHSASTLYDPEWNKCLFVLLTLRLWMCVVQ